jgi:hypothetical protein
MLLSVEAACTIAIIVSIAAAGTALYLRSTIVPSEFSEVGRVAHPKDVEWRSGTMLFYECAPEINIFIASKWSHVAMVVEGDRQPLVVDMTPKNEFVAVRPLGEIIHDELSDGRRRLAIRQICGSRSLTSDLRAFVDTCALRGVRYRHDYWRSVFGRMLFGLLAISPARREDSFFCSDFVATALQWAGAIPNSVDVASMLPPDLANERLPTTPDFDFEPLTFLRF